MNTTYRRMLASWFKKNNEARGSHASESSISCNHYQPSLFLSQPSFRSCLRFFNFSVLSFGSNFIIMMGRDQTCAHKMPTLVDLCVQKVIDNVRYLGNVGCVDQHLLEQILPHCTAEQLMHVENSTEGRDLSPVTDKLWKKFFGKKFGTNCTNEAKGKEMAQAEDEALDRIKQLYKKEDARKQSRQVRPCTKVPASSKRRFWGDSGPGYNVSNVKSNIMKKAKIDFLKSHEVKNLAAMKKNFIQRSQSSSSFMKTVSISGIGSTSKDPKSTRRVF